MSQFSMRWLDLIVVLVYMAAMAWMGLRFSKRQTSTEAYFVAKRSIPAWAIGISLFATLISSVTYVAYPGASYAKDWSLLVPGFMLLLLVPIVGLVIIPFYRGVVGMSAYEYFGKRFGRPTRMYSALAFALGHFSKMGFVFYLLALTIHTMTGWNIALLIIVVGVVTVFYTVIGGLEAVIWTDVVQGFVMLVGVFICLAYLLFLPPGGPSAVLGTAWQNHKISLGSPELDLSKPTLLVLIVYGFFWYLQKYVADQTAVQRYLVAKSDRQALRGILLGAGMCVPVWTLFMLIGTSTWAFYRLTGEKLPAAITKADQVFPHFLSTHIPAGLAGLFIASLLAAAMSTLASDLNCIAVVAVEDFYRVMRPHSTDARRLTVAKWIIVVFGAIAVAMAILLVQTKGAALSMWFSVSAILAGGLAGLFLLAFLSRRANRQGVYTGILASLGFTAWATLTLGNARIVDLGRFNFPWHDYTIGAIGHVILLVVGYLASLAFGSRSGAPEVGDLTVWGWLEKRRSLRRAQAAVS